jgi:hypothetical protein
MDEAQYYYHCGDEVVGPFNLATLLRIMQDDKDAAEDVQSLFDEALDKKDLS